MLGRPETWSLNAHSRINRRVRVRVQAMLINTRISSTLLVAIWLIPAVRYERLPHPDEPARSPILPAVSFGLLPRWPISSGPPRGRNLSPLFPQFSGNAWLEVARGGRRNERILDF